MRKLILISLFLTAMAGLALATPVTCAVLMNPNTTGNNSNTCTVTPDPGFFISSLTLTGTDDYTGLQSGGPTVSYSGTISQNSNVFTSLGFCNVTTGGSGSNPCSITINPTSTVTGLDLSTYSFGVTNAGNTVVGGVVTGDSEVYHLDYGETQNPGGVPEPTTLSLVGGALLGLGFITRKKKQ